MTRRPIAPKIAELREIIREGYPAGLEVRWVQRPRRVTFPTGVDGYVGSVRITAPGYRPTTKRLSGEARYGWRLV